MANINIEVLINLLKDSVGIEAAEKIIYQAIYEGGFSTKTIYTEEEFRKICDALKKRGGFIRTIATIASTSSFHNIYYQRELAKEKKENEDLARWKESLERKVGEKARQLKEAQGQLIQSAKMSAIGQLGSGIAHELNNPLACILGYTQFVLQKIDDPNFSAKDFKTFRRYFEDIEISTKRCKKIVENLLALTQRRGEKFERININELVDKTLSLMRSQLEREKVKLDTGYSKGEAVVSGDHTLLQHAFINIIMNAKEAMPKGGKLNIRIGSTDSELTIVFKDTGCGIPPNQLGKIFDPFFTTKQAQKALGLGMLISYQIIKQHNGDIDVISEVGKGSAFTITLPKAK